MRWRVLGPLLGVVLLGAVLFSMWPSTPPPVIDFEPPAPTPVPTPAPEQRRETFRPAAAPAPVAAPPVTAAPAPAPTGLEPDPPLDQDYLLSQGLKPEDLEPLDGGPLHPLTRDGIRSAVTEELPAIRECYEAWLQQNPALGGKLKVQFTIAEVPGHDRAKITHVDIADGGMGHVAMEGCVRNVFKGMRFEAPKNGETRVSYPLAFEPAPKP